VRLYIDPVLRDATHKIVQRVAQPGELGGQISFSHISEKLSLSQSSVVLLASDMN
jgi:hypothetical protein